MDRDSIKTTSFKFFLLAFLLMPTSNLFAADTSCENCNKVPGMPTVETKSIEKVLGETTSNLDLKSLRKMCTLFLNTANYKGIDIFTTEIENKGFSPSDVFSKVGCLPHSSISQEYKIPIIQYLPVAIDNNERFPDQIYQYLKKFDSTDKTWAKIINTENDDKMTLLDMVKFQENQSKSSPVIMEKLKKLKVFLCKTGGKFSQYREEKCDTTI